MNKILDAREKRANHILELMNEFKQKTIVIIKTNVPGANKNPRNMGFICHYFSEIFKEAFGKKILYSQKIKSFDGDYFYFVVSDVGKIVKEKTIAIEELNSLGRLIDIDVFNESSITREDINRKARKCLICDNDAHICSRNKKHSESELFNEINKIINDFIIDLIFDKTISSIYSELRLYPKFGLVSEHDSGCHTDMDSNTFETSISAIKPFIKEFIIYGINDLEDPIKLQEIGIKAEKAMLKATSNVNTHKGLIFALGVFIPSLTKAILKQEDSNFIIKEIMHISKIIIGDYYKNLEFKKYKSHGDKIYLSYGIKGLRGEALKGFDIIFMINSFNDKRGTIKFHEYLINLMANLDDTTIIHKTNIETLNEVKSTFSNVVTKGGYDSNKELINQLSDSYIKKNISPGGSADLLVLKIIFEELKYLLKN